MEEIKKVNNHISQINDMEIDLPSNVEAMELIMFVHFISENEIIDSMSVRHIFSGILPEKFKCFDGTGGKYSTKFTSIEDYLIFCNCAFKVVKYFRSKNIKIYHRVAIKPYPGLGLDDSFDMYLTSEIGYFQEKIDFN